jgi:orotidine-5'-phosphate decarboxylase
MTIKNPEERIIVALDSPSFGHAFSIVLKLREKFKLFKVGPVLFLSNGPNGIEQLKDLEVDIFLDLKFHDIPSTVEKTMEHIVNYGVNMFTVHSLGGFDMMNSVCERIKKEAKKKKKLKPMVLAVTMLTSHDEGIIKELGLTSKIKDQVLKLAALSDKAGVDGIVCSGHEVGYLKKEFADRFKYIVPGIRLGDKAHDQKRNITPAEAFENGADYIVIGRSIAESHKPEVVAEQILNSLK